MSKLKMKLMSKISSLLDYFEIHDYSTKDNMIAGPCPIHNGDNQSAFNINIDPSSEYYGSWFCNTKHCHESGNDVIALVSQLLSTKSYKSFSFVEVLRFCNEFTKNVKLDFTYQNNKQDELSKILERNNNSKIKGRHSKEQVRSRLSFPCKYYIERGFDENILDAFDVGVCKDAKSEMYNRAVFPVYDENDQYMIGCVGRTVNGHDQKWKNKKGFNKASFLYNYGKAIKEIGRSCTIILVEGQGDVIKLHMAGIKNAVGIFGSHLSDSQVFLLQKSGALNVVIMTDNDETGSKCREEIKEKLKYSFNIFDVITPTNDIGDMTIEEIDEIIKPQMKGLF